MHRWVIVDSKNINVQRDIFAFLQCKGESVCSFGGFTWLPIDKTFVTQKRAFAGFFKGLKNGISWV